MSETLKKLGFKYTMLLNVAIKQGIVIFGSKELT